LREARESSYRLRLIEATGLASASTVATLRSEASELIAIFTKTTRRTRAPLGDLNASHFSLLTSHFSLLSSHF
jgi:hypothetical protein